MPYSIHEICAIVEGKFLSRGNDDIIENLVHDSRRLQQASGSLFFALVTKNNDGHFYIDDAYKKGIRNFIISNQNQPFDFADANVILVQDTLAALQKLAAFHRTHFAIPVIGITGSNGKTIVKEWLYQLLQDDHNIVRSPKSFNSQIGVPLSVWQMNEQHTLAIFEAGISTTGEMEHLGKIIQPTIGVLTNIGEAHDAGFSSKDEKIKEKLKLFNNAEVVIGDAHLLKGNKRSFTIGEEGASLKILSVGRSLKGTEVTAFYNNEKLSITVPFSDNASVQNAITCWAVLLYLNYSNADIQNRTTNLHPVDMRLQLRQGINDCIIINDSYSADTTSMKIALDFLQQQSAGRKSTVILSEFFESGKNEQKLYREILQMLKSAKVNRLIAVGEKFLDAVSRLGAEEMTVQFYASTENLVQSFRSSSFSNEIILIKGARRFHFEKVVELFEKKLHQTVLEINLNALAHNLKQYRSLLKPQTRLMAMVKAFSYGSGGAEIASVLQFHNVDYLGVAYADEGVDLIKAGIHTPVMVMNAEESSFHSIVDYNLQPVIYSFRLLKELESFLNDQALSSYPVHLEIETGMNRLGFQMHEMDAVAQYLSSSSAFSIQTVFTHLAASEDPAQDAFTLEQFKNFKKASDIIKQHISQPFLSHIANSAAIIRHRNLQMDMVRLGIGLYGVETHAENKLDLQPVATLRSTIAQLKLLRKGESVSYNRKGVVNRDSLIATVRIGYADGYSRRMGNGAGKMMVRGKLVPVIGAVCMDMTMIDVTDVSGVSEGDDVIIFGQSLPIQQVAQWAGTIPYEIMTGVSQRVKRLYFFE